MAAHPLRLVVGRDDDAVRARETSADDLHPDTGDRRPGTT